ncbi:MAG: prepilin-type N-terminal cleavage/methylation domain-containing protein [Planctomycetes bacterium]|nr:prepilin-type N-terminal cleavage/methylation domain-containing protein [Planctomycetota bacterium]
MRAPAEPSVGAGLPRAGPAAGFTLLELLVVISIMGLITQLVIANLGALVPARTMDKETAELAYRLDYVRSEARMAGKTFRVQFDLDNQRWRLILPPEDRLVSTQTIEEDLPLEWNQLDPQVRMVGAQVAGGMAVRSGIYEVIYDQSGFSADQALYFRHRDDEELVWTLQMRGLIGRSDVLTNAEGKEQPLEPVTEGSF